MAEQAVRLLTLLAYDVALRANSRLAAAEGLSGAYSPHGRALRGPFLLYCNFFCGESLSLIQNTTYFALRCTTYYELGWLGGLYRPYKLLGDADLESQVAICTEFQSFRQDVLLLGPVQ